MHKPRMIRSLVIRCVFKLVKLRLSYSVTEYFSKSFTLDSVKIIFEVVP